MNTRLGGWGLWVLAGVATADCREPATQVELRVSTDLPCSEVHGTTLTVGARGQLEDAFPSASLPTCEPGADGTHHLGFVTLVPRGEDNEALALKVVTAVTALSPDDCKPADGEARGYRGCIVARRELRYRPGHTLRLEVPMLRQCEGVECTVDSTCFDATTCMPAGVTCSREACVLNETPELRFSNPEGPGSAAGIGGAAGAGGTAADGASGTGGAAGAGQGDAGSGGASGTGGTAGTSGGGVGGGPLFVSQVVAGGGRSCALVSGGAIQCWGFNGSGQLGNGTTTDQSTPVSVRQSPDGPPLIGAQTLALGDGHSCALLSGGQVQCWGSNISGQLGNGTTNDQSTPVSVRQSPDGPPLTGAQTLALGNYHSCARLTGDQVHCWGDNRHGALGDGTTTNRNTPASVLQSPTGPSLAGVQALTLGSGHSCALLTGGPVQCWGRNSLGQLGDGTTNDRYNPVPVVFPP
jgi:Regulator of chromosome condensation (RCC1) repeat